MAELEDNNAKLLAELEQAHLVLTEAVAARNSLSVTNRDWKKNVRGLRAAIDTLEQEKAKTATDHEAEVALTNNFF
jgi:hypothetical protein